MFFSFILSRRRKKERIHEHFWYFDGSSKLPWILYGTAETPKERKTATLDLRKKNS